MTRYWQPGEQAVLRYRRSGKVSYVFPITVVVDTRDMTALFLAAGTPIKKRVGPTGEPTPRDISYEDRSKLPVILGDGVWKHTNVLILVRPHEAHDVRLFFEPNTDRFLQFYVNLQRPVTRLAIGFETSDHVLDLEIQPDKSWHWKDEDEFADAQRIGRFSVEEATAIRSEGEQVIRDATMNRWPFNAGWEHWRPDPEWPLPSFPEGWDQD